jgi:hypothetical protein
MQTKQFHGYQIEAAIWELRDQRDNAECAQLGAARNGWTEIAKFYEGQIAALNRAIETLQTLEAN